jgi:hypothetical protein
MSILGTITFEKLVALRLQLDPESPTRRDVEAHMQRRSLFFHAACAYYLGLPEPTLRQLARLVRRGWDVNAPRGAFFQMTSDGPFARSWDAFLDPATCHGGLSPGHTPWSMSLEHTAAFERACLVRHLSQTS